MSKTIKHFKTERIMVLHEGKNDQWDSGAENPVLALMPLDFDGSFQEDEGYTDEGDVQMPFFAFGDSDDDDEDYADDDEFDDDFDDDSDDYDDEKDEFNFIKDDYDEDPDDDDDFDDDDDDYDDEEE